MLLGYCEIRCFGRFKERNSKSYGRMMPSSMIHFIKTDTVLLNIWLRYEYFSGDSKITDKIVLARFEGGYRGIYARQNILKGEEIIKGNPDAIIDQEVALAKFNVIYFLRQAWVNDDNVHLTDNLNLVLYILLSTRFQPTLYTRSLPEIETYKLNFPSFWSEELLAMMPPKFQTTTEKRIQNEESLFHKLLQIWPTEQWGDLTRDDFFVALYQMSTRIVGLSKKTKPGKKITQYGALLPVFDLINHGNDTDLNVKIIPSDFPGEKSYRMIASKDIRKGEELFTQYGKYSDLALLQRYGFILHPPLPMISNKTVFFRPEGKIIPLNNMVHVAYHMQRVICCILYVKSLLQIWNQV